MLGLLFGYQIEQSRREYRAGIVEREASDTSPVLRMRMHGALDVESMHSPTATPLAATYFNWLGQACVLSSML